jgi:hypothetical protein
MKAGAVSTVKAAIGLAVVPAVAVLGGPAVAAAAILAALLIGGMCWVLADTRRAARLAILIHVSRGNGTIDMLVEAAHGGERPGKSPEPTRDPGGKET